MVRDIQTNRADLELHAEFGMVRLAFLGNKMCLWRKRAEAESCRYQ